MRPITYVGGQRESKEDVVELESKDERSISHHAHPRAIVKGKILSLDLHNWWLGLSVLLKYKQNLDFVLLKYL